MNEALFSQGRFSDARAVGRPDFEVLLTLTCLRQVNTPTAKATMAIPHESGCADDSIAILAGAKFSEMVECAFFYDLSAMEWAVSDRATNYEDGVNLGISGYFQTPPLNAVSGQDTNTGFESL